jgi:hypothetical protein
MLGRQCWEQLGEVWKSAPEKVRKMNSAFLSWVLDSYAVNLSVGLRRVLDTDRRVGTLGRLLDEMTRFPSLITREGVMANTDASDEEIREGFWAEFALPGGVSLDPARPRQALDDLRTQTEPVRTWVNKRVAHRDLKAPEDLGVTWDDLHSMIDSVWDTFKRYRLLLLNVDTSDTIYGPAWRFRLAVPR